MRLGCISIQIDMLHFDERLDVVTTLIHNCVRIFWFTSKNKKNAKMGFYNQLNMFCMIISYTCDLLLN
jgi:hypothetical protein